MSDPQAKRRSYEDSCLMLQRVGWLTPGAIPQLPPSRPSYDDEQLGVEFFRTSVTGEVFEKLTLPRTFFGRSDVKDVSYSGTDLSESTLCWNDFTGVNFSNCDLANSDMRAAIFESVNFSGANLNAADMRRSTFDGCDFSNAILRGTKWTRAQAKTLALSISQLGEIDWQDSDGEEPGGG